MNTPEQRPNRVTSIDIVRGLIMVIMALDHTREFWGATSARPEDVAQTSVLLFFTRWITHLCAPGFIFLSGASIYFYQSQKQSNSATSVFLLSRGAWLIAVEILLMSFILTHSYDTIVLSILWAIGWCMIVMSAVIWLPRPLVLAISVVMISAHNLWPTANPVSSGQIILGAIHNSPFFIPQAGVLVTYTIIPWLGVMMAGYGLGKWFRVATRERLFRVLGTALLFLFMVIRMLNEYGDPVPYSTQERGEIFTLLSFLNVTKYPPSLLFLLVTLGILFLLLTVFKKDSAFGEFLLVYGNVPFFFFVVHFALISLTSYLWTVIAFGQGTNLAFTPFDQLPATYEPSLLRVYLVWLAVIAVMYFPCRWFGRFKRKHGRWWLSYL